MKIIVMGNVGSGKSTLTKKLNELTGFSVVRIDDFRKQFGDWTYAGEINARDHFFYEISIGFNLIIECTGIGDVSDKLFEILIESREHVICLILIVNIKTCLKRIKNRIWDVPFHLPQSNISIFMNKISISIESQKIIEPWRSRKNTVILFRNNGEKNSVEKISSEVYQNIINLEKNERY